MRRSLISPCIRWLVAGACLAGLPSGDRAADWPQFLGPNRDGTSSETGLIASWKTGGPTVAWEYPLGAGWAGPVVADGKVYITYRTGDRVVLDCLDTATGRRRWRSESATSYRDDFGFDEGPRATPLLAGTLVVTLGADGQLRAVETATGKEVWKHATASEYQVPKGFFGTACSPLLEGGRIIVQVGGKGAGVVAFDAASGREVWKATDDAAGYASPIAATVGGSRSILCFTREGLVALDPANGTVRFRKPWRSRLHASVNAATPLIVGDQVFLSASYGTGAAVLRLRPGGVEEVWKGDETLSNHYNTSVVHDGHLYGIDGRQEGGARLRCVEWATGKVCWTKEGFGCAALILADGYIFALTERGELVAFAATPDAYRETGRKALLTEPCRAATALADGRLFARDAKRLIAVKMK